MNEQITSYISNMKHKKLIVKEINELEQNPQCMYIFVNDDLKMGKGKIAGQVGHVVGLITEEIIRKSYETSKGVPDSYER